MQSIQEVLQAGEVRLNIGCSVFKIPGLTNIDLDPKVSPDLLLDLNTLDTVFPVNSVDYIQAGHVFEHFVYEDSLSLMKKCHKVLKPFRLLIVVVPDFKKAGTLSATEADRIVLAGGEHKMLCDPPRIHSMLKASGFTNVFEIQDLKEVPFLIVPDLRNPVPEFWQTAFVAFKLY